MLSLYGIARLSFTARIEGPLLYHGASASTETMPAVSPLLQAHSLFLQAWGLIDLLLRATFSPAHPLVRRDVPVAQARPFRGRAFREQEDDQVVSSSFSVIVSPCLLDPIITVPSIPAEKSGVGIG